MGWRAEGADNPAMATQGRGLGAGGTFIPQNRFIQVLRGVCTGLDPSARAASQKPATYGAQGRCGEPHAPTMCWGVDGEPPPPGRSTASVGEESPWSKAYIPPPRVFILGKETLQDPLGLRFLSKATDKERANHRMLHGSIRWSPTLGWLLRPGGRRVPLGTPLSFPTASLRCWGSPSRPLLLREGTCVGKKAGRATLSLCDKPGAEVLVVAGEHPFCFACLPCLLLLLGFITFGGFRFCNPF